MSNGCRVSLNRLSTGVPGLDEVLGGGLPEYSFSLLAGSPGSGNTTLIHQLAFANASAERPALYFTVVGEPVLRMLRYQQQMDFFDAEQTGSVIRFVDLSDQVLTGQLALEVGLTRPESAILRQLRSLRGGATLDQLVELTGQPSVAIKQRLNRLLGLGYARPRAEQDATLYEA